MDDADLLPCPFCGSPAFAADMRMFEDGNPSYIVHCRGCHAQTAPCSFPSVERSRAEAVHRWNQRVVVVDDGPFLLPCPCCGGDAATGDIDLASDQVRRFYGEAYDSLANIAKRRYFVAVSCKTCGLFGTPYNHADYNRSKSEAVHAWNQRVGDVLTVPTKPDLTSDREPAAPAPRKSNPWVVFAALCVIGAAVVHILRQLLPSLL